MLTDRIFRFFIVIMLVLPLFTFLCVQSFASRLDLSIDFVLDTGSSYQPSRTVLSRSPFASGSESVSYWGNILDNYDSEIDRSRYRLNFRMLDAALTHFGVNPVTVVYGEIDSTKAMLCTFSKLSVYNSFDHQAFSLLTKSGVASEMNTDSIQCRPIDLTLKPDGNTILVSRKEFRGLHAYFRALRKAYTLPTLKEFIEDHGSADLGFLGQGSSLFDQESRCVDLLDLKLPENIRSILN